MAPGLGIKVPVPRTRTGCLTCRKRKVKCDEVKPLCGRCLRLHRECTWSDLLQVIPHQQQDGLAAILTSRLGTLSLQMNGFCGQNFVIDLPSADKISILYTHHFVTFCCRFLAYSNDNERNPFQEELVPHANSSPALLYSMTALAAGDLTRSQPQHKIAAARYYSLALHELTRILSDPGIARSDATLGACLLLCVYEILQSENDLWLHLQGARDLILFRGGPRTTDYLTRFFSFLDVSKSLSSGAGPLLDGNYRLEDGSNQDSSENTKLRRWPYYDADNIIVDLVYELMIYMAKLSRLSSDSMSEHSFQHQHIIIETANEIHYDLLEWWQRAPPSLRDQGNDWRKQTRTRKLTVPETLKEEAFSSVRSRMRGCIIYLNYIFDPLGREPQKLEVIEAIKDILEIAEETLEGYGLEMGIYWGLFMAGVAIFNDSVAEDLIRRKLKADNTSIWHADQALDLFEVLWRRQYQYGAKYDWRQVQIQMGIQVFILA